jgi:hypothetical protein
MKIATKMNGFALAAAAATLFLAAPMASAGDSADAKVGQCMGANSCKGNSACATAKNSCKGQNACKGQGFLEMNKADCATAGGKFQTAK